MNSLIIQQNTNIQSIFNTTLAILLLLQTADNMRRFWSSKQPAARSPTAIQPRSHSLATHVKDVEQRKENSRMDEIGLMPTLTKTWGCLSALSERSDDESGTLADGEWLWVEDGKWQCFDSPAVDDDHAQQKLLEASNFKSPSSETGPMRCPPTRSTVLQETPRTTLQNAATSRSRLPRASSSTVNPFFTSQSLQQVPLKASQRATSKCTLARCVYVRNAHTHSFHQTAGYPE